MQWAERRRACGAYAGERGGSGIERVDEALAAHGVDRGDSLAIAAASYPHPEIAQASTLYRAVNVSLAQARSRKEKRVAFFEGF